MLLSKQTFSCAAGVPCEAIEKHCIGCEVDDNGFYLSLIRLFVAGICPTSIS